MRNGGALLDEQLAALARQRIDRDWELVIVDNGSTDDSMRRVEKMADEFAHLTVVTANERAGLSYARNEGTKAARGAVIAFCDADDVVRPDWLVSLSEQVKPGTLVGGALAYDRLNDPVTAFWRDLDGPMSELPIWFRHRPVVMGANFAITKADLERLGGFDETFTGSSDEVDLCYRAYDNGIEVAFAPDAVVDYRLRNTIRAAARQQNGYGRANALLYRKHRATIPAPRPGELLYPYWRLLRCLHHLVRGRALRGHWMCDAAYRRGRLSGSLEARVWFI